jgi:transketolase
MSIEPFAQKWAAFGWHVIEVNGHNFPQLIDAFTKAKEAIFFIIFCSFEIA